MGTAAVQGPLWGRAAHDWAELQEPLAAPLWEALLDAAGVGPGTRVLDAGCGAGGASVLVAARGARVNGLAAALVTIARQRVPDGDFRVGDLEALPYADAVFDAVLAANVLPYVADPLAALCEVRRVCLPGGRVVLATWGAPQGCAQWAIVAAVRERLRSMLLAPLGEEPPALSTSGTREALVAQAGLRVLGGGTVACPYQYPDAGTAWQAQASAGPLQAALRAAGTAPLKAAVLHCRCHFPLSSWWASTSRSRDTRRGR